MTGCKTLTLAVVAAVAMLWGAASAAGPLTYTTGIDVWFDASDMNGNGDNNLGWSDGYTLTTARPWVNKGSVGNPVSYAYGGAGSPVYRTSVIYPVGGTGPAVAFNLSNLRLPEFMDSPNVSIFAVVQWTGSGDNVNVILWDYGTSGDQVFAFAMRSGDVYGYVRDSPSREVINVSGTSNIGTSVAVVAMVLDGTTMEAGPVGFTDTATNAEYDSTTTWSGTHTPPVVGTFPNPASAHFLIGNIFELLIFDHAVTGSDRTAVENYLHYKYIEPKPAGTMIVIQ